MTDIQIRVERELTYVIGEYARTWALLEHWLSRLMAVVLRLDHRASDVIYHALRNDRARRDVIKAAATVLREDDDRRRVGAFLRRAGRLARDRANYLHNITEVHGDGAVLIHRARVLVRRSQPAPRRLSDDTEAHQGAGAFGAKADLRHQGVR